MYTKAAMILWIVFIVIGVELLLLLLSQLQLPYEQLLNTQDKLDLFFIFFTFNSMQVTYRTKNNYLKPLSTVWNTVLHANPCDKQATYSLPFHSKVCGKLTP